MNHRKVTLFPLLTIGMLLVSGCGETPQVPNADFPASPEAFIYKGRNFGTNRNEAYKQGVMDGCETSMGTYKKDHVQYNGNVSYHHGWEHGRIHCNPDDKVKYNRYISAT